MESTYKKFICECGKEFDKPNSFNAHKSNCRIHLGEERFKKIVFDRSKKSQESRLHNIEKRNKAALELWISEHHQCERCGKVMVEKYGSGRFCCQSCANTRDISEDTRLKISNSVNKETLCYCKFCGKESDTLTKNASHERRCRDNPNRIINKVTQKDYSKPYVIRYNGAKFELDVSIEYINNYRQVQTVCEICGRPIEETVKWDSKNAPKNLCVDHDHETNTFRGLLCSVCNRQLGWYEKNKEAIEAYLSKNK